MAKMQICSPTPTICLASARCVIARWSSTSPTAARSVAASHSQGLSSHTRSATTYPGATSTPLRKSLRNTDAPPPWWVDEEIKLLEAKGYKDNFAETLQITKDFQFRAWKNALEGIRASHLLSGFHMLQFADTDKYENSNGVVDCFDDPHGISPEQFRKFNADTAVSNTWELWAFPAVSAPIAIDARCDMNADYLTKAVGFNPASTLTVTDKLDDSLFERLENGEDVMLIYRTAWTRHLLDKSMSAPEYSFVHTWERYKGVICDRGTISGGRDDKDTLNSLGFVTDGQINFQYYPLIEDSDKINLDDFPVKAYSLVSGLDKCNRDRFDVSKFKFSELRPERSMRNFSYAFELRVGKGRLLVTGFNFKDTENPAVIAMLKTLVSYCHSGDFGRGAEIPTADLKAYLSATAAKGPQKEGMMTQYWQLDAEPVESMEYWIESERYLREDM